MSRGVRRDSSRVAYSWLQARRKNATSWSLSSIRNLARGRERQESAVSCTYVCTRDARRVRRCSTRTIRHVRHGPRGKPRDVGRITGRPTETRGKFLQHAEGTSTGTRKCFVAYTVRRGKKMRRFFGFAVKRKVDVSIYSLRRDAWARGSYRTLFECFFEAGFGMRKILPRQLPCNANTLAVRLRRSLGSRHRRVEISTVICWGTDVSCRECIQQALHANLFLPTF